MCKHIVEKVCLLVAHRKVVACIFSFFLIATVNANKSVVVFNQKKNMIEIIFSKHIFILRFNLEGLKD